MDQQRRSTPRKENRNQQRRALSVQLVEGRDDDLISVLEGVKAGTQQAEVKRLLRLALALPEPTAPISPVDKLRSELQVQIDALRAHPAHNTQTNDEDNNDALRSEIDVLRAQVALLHKTNDELTTWANQAHQDIQVQGEQLHALHIGGYQMTVATIPEPEPQPENLADDATIAKREKNMRRNQW